MNAPSSHSPAPVIRPNTALDHLISAGLWGVGLGFMVPMMGSMMVLQRLLSSETIDPLARFYCRGQLALTGNRWRTIVHPKVDPNQPYIFAQNHTNHLDHVAMYCATPHFKQGLELETHFRYPVYGWFMKGRGTIPVPADRSQRTAAVREGIQAEIDKGHSVLAFPEGTRTLDGRVGTFRKGIFVIARDLGIPIVPTAVTGMFDVMRKGSYVLHPGNTVTVHVEEPVETAGLSDDDIPALAERTRSVVARHVDAYYAERRDR